MACFSLIAFHINIFLNHRDQSVDSSESSESETSCSEDEGTDYLDSESSDVEDFLQSEEVVCGQQYRNMAATKLMAPTILLLLAVSFNSFQPKHSNSQANRMYFDLYTTFAPREPSWVGFEVFHRVGRQHDQYAILISRRSTSKPFFFLSLLLLSANVELNPGPNYKFSCGLCAKPVRVNQKSIQCNMCNIWFHTCCLHMCNMYNSLANSSAVWIYTNVSSSLLESESSMEHPNPILKPEAS